MVWVIRYETTETLHIYHPKFKPIVRKTKHQHQGNKTLNMFAHASIRVKIADCGFHFSVIYECFAGPSVPVCVLKRTVYIAVSFTDTHAPRSKI